MEKAERQGDGCCVGGLLLATALLPPPISPPRGRRRWGRPTVPGRPCCRRGASRSWRGDSTASFSTWVGGFLTVAHMVSKRLLVARELKSKLRVPSEPFTELIPSSFGVEIWAILVVWAICHLRSEGISIAVVVTEDSSRDFGQHIARRQQVPPRARHGNPYPGGQPLSYYCTFCFDVPLLEIAKSCC